MNITTNQKKYLDTYAEAETAMLETFPDIRFKQCVLIPARDESSAFLQRFIASFDKQEQKILLILIINQPASQPDQGCNKKLHIEARQIFNKQLWQNKHLCLSARGNTHLLSLDRYSTRKIPDEQGVGLARKIGADIACKLYAQGKLENRWVYCSDADAVLPDNYFSGILDPRTKNASAMVFDFEHTRPPTSPDDKCWHATQLYQQALKYYRSGLEYAGSPYAFYTLGSTLAFSIEHYCQSRGFPKKSGGEDFYLLNKLAKLGNIFFDKNIRVKIYARKSARVPFGTGPAVEKIMGLNSPDTDYLYYQAEIFKQLKQVLVQLPLFWQNLHADTFPFASVKLTQAAEEGLGSLNIEKFLQHAQKQCKTEQMFYRQFHQWFDAFNTLKFIHYLQNNYLPAQTLSREMELLNGFRNA
ncbi:hypothetical protein SAMN02745866_02810 [Alteromonadaceae bacterium Bs31]|nr:hypothetical protein SAMN02745866_02810 [Alteromonadaceae bacterium Bs31]